MTLASFILLSWPCEARCNIRFEKWYINKMYYLILYYYSLLFPLSIASSHASSSSLCSYSLDFGVDLNLRRDKQHYFFTYGNIATLGICAAFMCCRNKSEKWLPDWENSHFTLTLWEGPGLGGGLRSPSASLLVIKFPLKSSESRRKCFMVFCKNYIIMLFYYLWITRLTEQTLVRFRGVMSFEVRFRPIGGCVGDVTQSEATCL